MQKIHSKKKAGGKIRVYSFKCILRKSGDIANATY